MGKLARSGKRRQDRLGDDHRRRRVNRSGVGDDNPVLIERTTGVTREFAYRHERTLTVCSPRAGLAARCCAAEAPIDHSANCASKQRARRTTGPIRRRGALAPMIFDIYELGLLLAVTTAVALVCERLRLPYAIGLILAGLALVLLLPFKIGLSLSKDLVYTFLLPPLVFEAALRLSWPRLRRDLPVILMIAGPGFIASALLLATGVHWIAGWSWIAAAKAV